jgi:hypothetical protein
MSDLKALLSTFLTTTGDSSEERRPKNLASKYGLAKESMSLWDGTRLPSGSWKVTSENALLV